MKDAKRGGGDVLRRTAYASSGRAGLARRAGGFGAGVVGADGGGVRGRGLRVRRVGEGVLDHRRRWSGVVCVWNFMWMPGRCESDAEDVEDVCETRFGDDGWKEDRWGGGRWRCVFG